MNAYNLTDVTLASNQVKWDSAHNILASAGNAQSKHLERTSS